MESAHRPYVFENAILVKSHSLRCTQTIFNVFFSAFSEEKHSAIVKSNKHFVHYILQTTAAKVEDMRNAPDYLQLKYSKSSFRNLCEISSIIFSKFIANFGNVFEDYDDVTALNAIECFLQCMISAVTLYDRKFKEFLINFVRSPGQTKTSEAEDGSVQVIKFIQKEFDNLLKKEKLMEEDETKLIPLRMIQTMEIILDHAPLNEQFGMNVSSYSFDLTLFHVNEFIFCFYADRITIGCSIYASNEILTIME